MRSLQVARLYKRGSAHVDNEMYLSRSLERLGGNALNKDQEPDIGAAFLKFAVVTKELSALMKTLMQNINNIVMFPLENLLKGDLRGVKGDLKRPFDKAWKDYEAKYAKIEKEKKQQAKEAGLIRSEVTSAEIADEMEKERRVFQLQMCEYLIKVNEIKTKKGIELLHILWSIIMHKQSNYFQDGLKTIEHFGSYVADLSIKLQKIRQKQDEERRRLTELRTLLRSAPGLEKEATSMNTSGTPGGSEKGAGYSLHQLQGDKQHGVTRTGHLLKKSEGKMRRVWQKRRCRVQAEGFLDICHADETKPPTRVNLLTCQIKLVPDDKRCFDLISYNRTYHFQAEDEADQRAWMSVLVNCKEGALMRAFDDSGKSGGGKLNPSLLELQQAIIRYVQKLPGNDRCCDYATWLSTNFGIIVCIECSGIHRDLGVHISRIQSLTLDNIGTSQLLLARHMTNNAFNEVMEYMLHVSNNPKLFTCPKLTPNSTIIEYILLVDDDETIIEDRVSLNKSRSRPPSYAGEDRTRPKEKNAICHSKHTGRPRTAEAVVETISGSGSIKKRAAPLPPGSYNMYGTLPNSHSRTPSDPIVANSHMGSTHLTTTSDLRRATRVTRSLDISSPGAKLVIPAGEPPSLKTTSGAFDKSSGSIGPGNIQRPRGPPPPTPSPMQGIRLSNGRSTESISSMSSDVESTSSLHNPVPLLESLKKERSQLESYAEESDLLITLFIHACSV
ncbi:hypothetical protein L9F63_028228, partial [Diploptera punctata]